MSQFVKGLSNKLSDVKCFVEHLSHMSYVERIWLVGSRSPLSHKKARFESDWDLMPQLIVDGHIPRPRNHVWNLAVDIFSYRERPDMVEIWPSDNYNIFNFDKEVELNELA